MKTQNEKVFLISVLIGFMLALQFNTTHTEEKDTRNLWELRQDYLTAKEMETDLLQIRSMDKKLPL